MAAVGYVARAEFRHRWRSWVALALLVAVVGGLVLAAASAGRRTASAFPRYAATYGYDSFVYGGDPLPKLPKLPEVASALRVGIMANGTPTCACTHPLNPNNFSVFEVTPASLPHFAKLLAGHLPDQSAPDQVLASYSLQQDYGVHIGTVISIPFFTAAQASTRARCCAASSRRALPIPYQ